MRTRSAKEARTPLRPAWLLLGGLLVVAAACAEEDAPEEDAPEDVEVTDEEPRGEDPPEGEDPAAADPAADLPTDRWEQLREAPVELTELDAEAHGGELWVVGGFEPTGAVSTAVFVYDPAEDRWRDGPDLPSPVHHVRLVSTGDDLLLIGGYRDAAFDPIDEVLVLDPAGEEWTVGPSLPAPRSAGGAAWDGERVVFGGGVGEDGLADEVYALASPDDDWELVAHLSVPRDHLDATSDGEGTVWFLGGRELSLAANLGTVDLLVGDGIEPLGELLTPRGGVAAFHTAAHGACLAGGEEPEDTFATVECVDGAGTVVALPDLQVPRHGLGAATIGDVAYVALGGPEPLLATSDVLEAMQVTGESASPVDEVEDSP